MSYGQRQRQSYNGYGYAPRYEPPKRKAWPMRHKFLTFVLFPVLFLVVVIVVVVIVAAASSGGSLGASRTAGLAACASHHAVSAEQWAQITKDPEAAKGQCVIVYGQVTQFDDNTGPGSFRAEAGPRHVAASYGFVNYPTDNVIFSGTAAKLKQFVAGDLFTAEVAIGGSATYDTVMGGSTSAPVMRVDSIAKTGHLDSY